jgi:quinol monooxygenase YgiN
MWAQVVKMRVQPGNDERFQQIGQQWEEQVGRGTDSGWVRSLVFRNADDPNEYYQVVFFESEEKARGNERNQKHQALLQQWLALAAGQPEYVDLTPVQESTR